MEQTLVYDQFRRPLRSLRISVTDRCNLRCAYCMPEEDYVWLPRESLLSFEEIARMVEIFSVVGVDKVRITGGEPLLRHDLPTLIQLIVSNPKVRDVALTTNGLLLDRSARDLMRAGLHRVTVSLDTLRPDRFKVFARSARHQDAIAGIDAASSVGFEGTKLNSVIIRGFNDDEMVDLMEFAGHRGVELRFIEYMDVGGATRWSMDDVVSRAEILETLTRHYGTIAIDADAEGTSAPAERFQLPDGRRFGIVSSTSKPFCGTCDRGRVTADGMYFLCLYADTGIDLREHLRRADVNAADAALVRLIREAWLSRVDRGAEARLAAPNRGALYQINGLRADPHREMHTRGG